MAEVVYKKLANGVIVINGPERLTSDSSDDYKKLLSALVDDGNFNIVIDLSATVYMDSRGLGAIVSKISVLRSNNGDIRITGINTQIRQLLEITHLNQILKSYPDLPTAVNSFKE
ncbi:MAG: STAS domain-containing protein [Calditrichaceae bacterium]